MTDLRSRARSPGCSSLVLLALGAACGASSGSAASRPTPAARGEPSAAPLTQEVGSDGGRLVSVDGRVVVDVPPGAVSSTTTFSVQPIVNTAPRGTGPGYRLGPAGTTFVRPVSLTFIAGWAQTPVTGLTAAFQDALGYWQHATDVRRDVIARTVTVNAIHFSDWTLVAADAAQDMAGKIEVRSTHELPPGLDAPVVGAGAAMMTLYATTSAGRKYLLAGGLALQSPTAGGAVCSSQALSTSFSNVAEVLDTPDRFDWGIASSFDVSCGPSSGTVDLAVDTLGIYRSRCARSYLPLPDAATPVITRERLHAAYQVDCRPQQGGVITATWDFFRCGGACTSANPCHTAAIACANGGATCTDDGNVPNGTGCGANQVCGNGTCNACTVGASCLPANPCHQGTTSCGTGVPVCDDVGAPLPNGTACGTDQVCSGGACSACKAGVACTPTNPCHAGVTDCSTGTTVCVDTGTPLANGTVCGTDQICNAGACGACVANAPCTSPADPCHVAATSCATGASVCVPSAVPVANGTSCGTGAVCNAGACSACSSGLACTPANACDLGVTSCATGTQTCTDTGAPAAPGASCGSNLVCNGAGACNGCAAGVACTPLNPCHVGSTSCATGASVCVDTAANQPNGTACTGGVCGAGACNACVADAPCVPANACHMGKTVCTSGFPVCQDTGTSVPNGTAAPGCGANSVCNAGACSPCTQGQACTLTNACIASASIQCATGTPVCTEATTVPDAPATACGAVGSSQTCQGGSCIATACVAGASCVPLNPCFTGTVTCGAQGAPASCTPTATPMPAGTSCGTNLVCSATGSCTACPGAAGTACSSTNPCAVTAAISCGTGIPVCADATFKADGSACGVGLVCKTGVCTTGP